MAESIGGIDAYVYKRRRQRELLANRLGLE